MQIPASIFIQTTDPRFIPRRHPLTSRVERRVIFKRPFDIFSDL